MTAWNFDMSQAPRGETRMVERVIGKKMVEVEEHIPAPIIAAGNGGVVTMSHWMPKAGRWNMFTKAVPPLAWMPWPEHPFAAGCDLCGEARELRQVNEFTAECSECFAKRDGENSFTDFPLKGSAK